MAKDMDYYLALLAKTTDTKEKLTLGQDLLSYLQEGSSIECQDIGMVVDSLLPYIQSSNFKVSQMGLDVMTELVRRMEHFYRPYIPSVLPSVIDRLGDSKEHVRERCQVLLMTFMETGVVTPQQLFDRLVPAFAHRNNYVRDEAMKCLVATLNQHGANCIAVSRIIPSIVKLLSDPNAVVRDEAVTTLTQVYRHVGERLRMDLLKKHNLPATKLPGLMAKFDEIKAANDFFPTAVHNVGNFADEDEPDRSLGSSRRSPSVTLRRVPPVAAKPPPPSVESTPSLPSSASKFSRTGSLRKPKPVSTPSSAGQAGAVDEEGFIKAFEAVPTMQIFSARDLEDKLSKIRQVIEDTSQDWSKRVDALKKVRSLLIAGALDYDEFISHLRTLDPAFQLSVKDLRSQVVREACVTVAFCAQTLGLKFEHIAESLIPPLINQIQNSAKVIATAGQVALGFIVRHTPAGRLIPHLVTAMSHKSREIRRAIIKAFHQLISSWPMNPLQRHLTAIQNALASAIADADQEVRTYARKAFWAFKDHFPDQADHLLNTLDAPYKRSLHSDMSNSSSSNSLHQPSISSRIRPPTETPTRRVLIPTGSTPASRRSNSAVDLQAAQRAKARAQYAALARQKVGSNASLPRPKKSDGPSSLTGPPSPFSPEHSRQGRSRTTRVSQSQPSSRSGSPSSRLNYATFTSNVGDRSRRSPSYSGSRSGATSRETSPGRYGMPPTSGGGRRGGSSIRSTLPSRPPLLSQRILHQSLEAETALADALGETNNVLTSPRRARLEDHSDDSETSSVCSERSFESNAHRRTSDSFSWSGSQSRLYRELWEPCLRDINEIMLACESTHWSDRKDGLVSLSAYLQAGNTLSPHQLARITDNFTKMLSDSHTKVFTLFLDTVSDLITTHCSDLHQWLYVLLTRLFHKLGSDLLTSVQAKIMRTLDTVREAFGPESVLGWALRFLVDPTQTPNARVKLAVLQWLAKTAPLADPSTAFPSVTGEKDITALALTKMIGWTMGDSIKQGSELRRAAQEAILALFNLNTPYVTLRFAQLPKEYQEAAASLIQGRVRKASGSLDSPVGKQESCLSPDQVYRSIKRTTAEIQSYTCDSKVADTASHDSGISQMSLNDKNDIDLLSNWTAQLSLSSPTRSTNGLDVPDSTTNGLNGTSELTGSEDTLGKTLDTIDTLAGDEKKLALSLLATHVKEADPVVISHHFKRILRIVLGYIQGDLESREASLSALCEMLKKRTLGSQLQSFTELILINVIKAYSDPNRELAKHTEPCIEEIANALLPDIVLRVLIPLMTAGTYPYNLSVIKAITKVIEAQPDTVLLPFLPELMPGLIQAYGHEESLVRKSAVFCMVALHDKVGDPQLRPFLVGLSASKLKLLELYINKRQSPKSDNS
uniref:CLIP-associating protein 1-A n=1 Tax=Lygus hesperus TaxID=30085 RepID=A0A0A9XT66_LYGHE